MFSPLNGITASKIFIGPYKKLNEKNSIVLIEGYARDSETIFLRAKASLRTLYLIGGWRKIFGLFTWIPFLDSIYKFIATHRHSIRAKADLSMPRERYLP